MFKPKEGKDFSKLERIYEKYKNIMYKEAYNILYNPHDAEDAVQLAFSRILNCLDRIKEDEVGMTCNFLKIIVKNVSKDLYKKKLYLNNKDDFIETMDIDDSFNGATAKEITDVVIGKESSNRIEKEIDKLPPIYRDIILLEKIYGYSREQTVALLNESEETLKKRMTRAKSKLLEALRKEGLNDGREDIRKNAR